MANYYYVARPTRNRGKAYYDYISDESGEWHDKARALQIRRWRALKRASKSVPKVELALKLRRS